MSAAQKPVTFLDLDAVAPERDFEIKLFGNKHKLVPVSVDQFVENVESLKTLAAAGDDLPQVIAIYKKMLKGAFPTLGDEDLGKLSLDQLNVLTTFAHQNSGQNQVKEEAEAENPPQAA